MFQNALSEVVESPTAVIGAAGGQQSVLGFQAPLPRARAATSAGVREGGGFSSLLAPASLTAPLPGPLTGVLIRGLASSHPQGRLAGSALPGAPMNGVPEGDDKLPFAKVDRALRRERCRQARGLTIPVKALSESLATAFQQPMTWLTQHDVLNLMRHGYRAETDCYQPGGQPEGAQMRALESGGHLACDGTQAQALTQALAGEVPMKVPMKAQRETQKEAIGQSPLAALARNNLFLVLKAGVSLQEVMDQVAAVSGGLGAKIFTDFLDVSPVLSQSFGQGDCLDRDVILDMRGWKRTFDAAVLHQLSVPDCVADCLAARTANADGIDLRSAAIFSAAAKKVQGQLQAWHRSGWVRHTPWLMPKLNRTIHTAVLRAVCAVRYSAQVAGWLPGQKQARALTKVLRQTSQHPEVKAVADTIDNGWIALQVLHPSAFQSATFDTLGGLPSGKVNGLAVGPQITILCDLPAEGTQREIDPRDHNTLSMIVHEGIHALDWLKQPERFDAYQQHLPDAVYPLERHAYWVQRAYLKDAMAQTAPPVPSTGTSTSISTAEAEAAVEPPVTFPLASLSPEALREAIINFYGLPSLMVDADARAKWPDSAS